MLWRNYSYKFYFSYEKLRDLFDVNFCHTLPSVTSYKKQVDGILRLPVGFESRCEMLDLRVGVKCLKASKQSELWFVLAHPKPYMSECEMPLGIQNNDSPSHIQRVWPNFLVEIFISLKAWTQLEQWTNAVWHLTVPENFWR